MSWRGTDLCDIAGHIKACDPFRTVSTEHEDGELLCQ